VNLQQTEPGSRKLRVLMLCAHEPLADPRISWTARSAAAGFDVTVLGFAPEAAIEAATRTAGGYRLVRLRRNLGSMSRYLWLLKDAATGPAYAFLTILAVLGAPILVVIEAALSLASTAMRRITAEPSGSRSHNRPAAPAPGVTMHLRNSLLGRLRFVFCAMRHQFAPAADAFGTWIRCFAQKPDVVHCNDLDTLLAGILAKVRFGSRVVYDAHEFYPESHPAGRWLDIKLLTALERFLIRKADAVVTVNPMLADVMREVYGLAHVYSIPNAEWWVEPRDRPLLKNSMASAARGRVKVLFQGRFDDGRGIEELIAGWRQVDGERAALFLRGPDNASRQAAIDLACRLELLDKSVFFLDPVSEDMLVAAAAEADIGVIPYKPLIRNDRFACPNKLSQYLHAGLMVVTNDLPYVRSVVEAAGAGVSYDSSDPSSLAGVVNRIAGDRVLLDRCRQNALSYAKHTFNWQCQAETVNVLYRGASPAAVDSSRGLAAKQLFRSRRSKSMSPAGMKGE
jgi:glycosyltransferase involved in cell wall biosynthesis